MKKLLAVSGCALVTLLAVLGALATVPHAHGSDLDHSAHKSCPVCQLGRHALDSVFQTSPFFIVAPLFSYFRGPAARCPGAGPPVILRLRSPPLPF